MLYFIENLIYSVRYFFNLIWPYAPDRTTLGKVGAGIRYFLHFLLVSLVLVGLYYLNRYFEIHTLIPDPAWARQFWLPILFLLLYALLFVGWWIYRILMGDAEASYFPDIDEAWDEAVAALDQAGISIIDVPLFLVLGRPETAEELLFQASQMTTVVKQAPVGTRYPLHVYASRDAVFVTCAGCSLLGKQASLLALEGIGDDPTEPGGPAMVADDGGATLKPGEHEQRIIKKLARLVGAGGQMSGVQRRALRRESNLPMPNLLANSAEVELHTSRMAHFCRLIFKDRQPYCPLNGVLVLVPLGATDTDLDAQQSADLCFRDLQTVRQILKVRCPMFAMLVDAEQLPGFPDFIRRRSAAERSRRIGQRFPLAPPDLNEETLHEKLDDSVKWLSDNVIRDLVYRVFKVETGTGGKLDVNHELFLLLNELRERKEHLSRFIVQGLARDLDGPLLFGGCYLGATGADKEEEQGFTRGVLQRLLENQNYVSWTPQALVEDARAHRIAFAGYTVLLLLVGLIVAGVGFKVFVQKPPA